MQDSMINITLLEALIDTQADRISGKIMPLGNCVKLGDYAAVKYFSKDRTNVVKCVATVDWTKNSLVMEVVDTDMNINVDDGDINDGIIPVDATLSKMLVDSDKMKWKDIVELVYHNTITDNDIYVLVSIADDELLTTSHDPILPETFAAGPRSNRSGYNNHNTNNGSFSGQPSFTPFPQATASELDRNVSMLLSSKQSATYNALINIIERDI